MTRWVVVVVLVASAGQGAETQTLPRGAFSLEASELLSSIDKQWSGDRQPLSLIEDNPRYEPGAGLQGILRARPRADFNILLLQLLYGVTDWLTVGVYVPIVLSTTVTTNLSWQPGDYQTGLGRQYSEDDFWQWAASLGQPRVPAKWVGNQGALSDVVLGARALLPQTEWMKRSHFRWAGTLQANLPTGKNFDPEEAVSAGTNVWELHAAGDIEAHLSADQPFWTDDDGVSRFNVGADVFYSFFRPRSYVAGTGAKNPLLNNVAPYVGSTYVVDPGDWVGATVSVDVSPILGPSRASIVSRGSEAAARGLPALLTLSAALTHVRTMQSDWQSLSPLWDWDHEKFWQPGDKTTVRVSATISFLRLGVPLQLSVSYRTQSLIPGRYTRAADVFSFGARTVFALW
jgi:hypothetical protein